MMGTVFHFLFQGHSTVTMFLSLVVLPKSVDSVACEFYCPITLCVTVCKKNMGRLVYKALYSPIVGLVCTMFGNVDDSCWQCACPIFCRYFPTSISAANVRIKTLNADSSHAILDFQSIFSWKCCWPRNAATQHWNNRFRIYGIQIPSHRVIGLVRMWSRLKLPQKCRSSKTILGRDGPGKIISQKHYKNLKCYQKVSHNVLASQSPSQMHFRSFGVYLIDTHVARPSLWPQVISCFSFTKHAFIYTCQIRQWCIKSLHVWYLFFFCGKVPQKMMSQRIKIASSWTMCNYILNLSTHYDLQDWT